MTTTASHQAGNSRRDQLTSALVVGGVLVVLGAASGLGIAVTSSAAPLIKPPAAHALALPRATGPTPNNYIGTPGPGNLPIPLPAIVVPSNLPSEPSDSSARSSTGASAGATPTTSTSQPIDAATIWPTLNCPSDVVTGLLDVLLGNKGLQSSAGLLKTVLNLLPNLASVLNGAGFSSVLTTNVGKLSAAQTNSMAQACTPVLSGLLSGGS